MQKYVLGAAAVAASVMVQVAGASAINDWNLIVRHNLTTNSEVEGRTMVGGNISGTSNYGTKLLPTSNYLNIDTLVIGGTIGANNYQVNSGRARLFNAKGAANFNMNGGGALIQNDNSVTSMVNSAWADVTNASSYCSSLSATNTVTLPGGQPAGVVFNSVAGPGGVAVFSVNGNSLFQNNNVQQMDINMNGATTVVINVAGTSITYNGGNMVGGFNIPNASKIIWNFYEATTLNIDRHFFGAILAPNAVLSNSTAIEGSVFADSFNQHGEVHLPNFAGLIPAPGALALAGFGLVVAGRRRR
ncbi:MAG: choice-of-anchor A family protein [Phycisphaeraceae bacterium]|nr:choice-of-anchor A family protein [Phycisphaeraceae bacterium]